MLLFQSAASSSPETNPSSQAVISIGELVTQRSVTLHSHSNFIWL